MRTAAVMDIYVTHKLLNDRQSLGLYQEITRKHHDANYVKLNMPFEHKTTWILSSPERVREYNNAVSETGFFWRAMHIDKVALWDRCSFAQPGAMYRVFAYTPPEPGADVLRKAKHGAAKYGENATEVQSWDGVVLACQQPHDKSVIFLNRTRSQADYWSFVVGACKEYGKHLFLKLHPCNQQHEMDQHVAIAKEYGCGVGKVRMSVIDNCKFVIVYSSTIAVDAWLRDVRVAQYAPGYFYRTGAVTYTAGEFPDDVYGTESYEQKMLDFLVWKYCFNRDMPPKDLIDMLYVFAESAEHDLFPMREEHSYGANIGLCEQI
jgi:hypothetical protein